MLLSLLTFAGCSDENLTEPEMAKGKVHFAMTTRAATSGTGVPQNPVPALDVERFNHYWVVVTDNNDNVVAIVNNDCSLTERDEFTVELSPGMYKAYGFANIPDSYLTGLGISKGNKLPNLSTILYAAKSDFFGNSVTTLLSVESYQSDYASHGNAGIPMTSKNPVNIKVTDAVTVEQSIEVVRMFAKVEFVFTNATATDLTLRSLAISNLTRNKADGTGIIPLMNDDDRDLSYLLTAPSATLTNIFGGGGLSLTSGGSPVSCSYYVLESVADQVTNSFLLDFDIVKTGETPSAKEDYMRYALTDPATLTAIRRNDWIRIPITINDWVMRLEARSYPPIGGYPEVEIEEDESNEFTVTFKTAGDFSIRPFIRKFYDGSDWFGIDSEKIKGTPAIDITGETTIFTTQPSIASTGEILGALGTGNGKALVTITVDVFTDAGKTVSKTLTRKIYIVKK